MGSFTVVYGEWGKTVYCDKDCAYGDVRHFGVAFRWLMVDKKIT